MVITPRAGGLGLGASSGSEMGGSLPGAGLSSSTSSRGCPTAKETLLLLFMKTGAATTLQERLAGKRVFGEP